MNEYLRFVDKVLTKNSKKDDRTGVGTLSLFGEIFKHDMNDGFPLITTKKMAHNAIRVELEGFIKGETSKAWYQERGCHIWDEWCNPMKIPYAKNPDTHSRMKEHNDLGPIYGFQWRHFGASYIGPDEDYTNKGIDQLANVVNELKENPSSRRLVVSAVNPAQQNQMALPPCHDNFQFNVQNGRLDLAWNQRSVDLMLGLPFNIASYGLLLELMSREVDIPAGKLIGFLGDVHIYNNHVDNALFQLDRKPLPLPQIKIDDFTSLLGYDHCQVSFDDYTHHDKLNFQIAV